MSEIKICHCRQCQVDREDKKDGIPMWMARMTVCDLCGNKRCPHASNHQNECSGSNARNQTGGVY